MMADLKPEVKARRDARLALERARAAELAAAQARWRASRLYRWSLIACRLSLKAGFWSLLLLCLFLPTVFLQIAAMAYLGYLLQSGQLTIPRKGVK